MHRAAHCCNVPVTFTLDRSMQRSAHVIFLSVCATIVSVGMWTVTVFMNLLHWVIGDSPYLRPVGWTALVLSAIGFWVLFYRHFERTVPRESRFD